MAKLSLDEDSLRGVIWRKSEENVIWTLTSISPWSSDVHSSESALSADCNGGCAGSGEYGDRDRGIHPGEGSEGDIVGD